MASGCINRKHDDPSRGGFPVLGVLVTAASCTMIGPARNPARIAFPKASVIWIGSRARETAVFNNMRKEPNLLGVLRARPEFSHKRRRRLALQNCIYVF
jgi:hypothetical protein